MNKFLSLTAIGIFAALSGGSIAVVHASIIGDFGLGYQDGKKDVSGQANG